MNQMVCIDEPWMWVLEKKKQMHQVSGKYLSEVDDQGKRIKWDK